MHLYYIRLNFCIGMTFIQRVYFNNRHVKPNLLSICTSLLYLHRQPSIFTSYRMRIFSRERERERERYTGSGKNAWAHTLVWACFMSACKRFSRDNVLLGSVKAM